MASRCSTTHASSLIFFFLLLISTAATPVAAQGATRVNVARDLLIVVSVAIVVTITVIVLVCVCAHCGPNLIMRAGKRKPKPKEPAGQDRLEV
ncbi:hypothetical protein DL766_010229 [Monosporascus sp. MC13-8B]|uniref:Uncharacterized protein n=1 Tax=Monosporascus cannonballus TaxID=155416 RepID=A0ABY0H4W7_9PEZI|nr:hypothetical protein DL762_006943 [Monosporascus cannonballus]RYO85877.1 hypothetical protein DL763_006908 [Monosporascus cannonballus]RYP05337.1 hypothetical protein DL766_010229 [Monosporascus sp. MC13-8B]